MEYVEREQNVACLDTGCGHDYRLKWSESAVFAADADAADEKGEPPSPSPPPKRRRGLSDGAIVSIAIVCVAGSALPISLLVACLHARRRKREEKLVRDLEGAG